MIKLFTHTDLDGVGNTILAYIVFGKHNVEVEYCDYNNVNEKIVTFLQKNRIEDYKSIYITDISVNDDVAKRVDTLVSNNDIEIKLFDHHPTAMDLNKYYWATVKPMLNANQKNCGTKLFYDYLTTLNYANTNLKLNNIKDFVDIVRKYDTWEWKETNFILSKQLNDLLYIVGIDDFVDEFYNRLFNESKFYLSEFDLKLLNIKQKEIDSYVKSCNKRMRVYNILGYNAGVVFAEQYSSEVGNRLCDMHPEIEFCVIINMAGSISYRSVGDKIDLGKDIASVYGGGGHPNSSGSPISDEIKDKIIEELFAR